jgi:hypothetical protein
VQVAATIMLALHFKLAATTEKVVGFTMYLGLAVHLADSLELWLYSTLGNF